MSTQQRDRPAWVREAGLLAADIRPQYERDLSPETESAKASAWNDEALAAAAEHGIKLIFVPFFLGMGLDFEKAMREQAQACIGRVHAHGLRAAARVSLGAVLAETLLAEVPEAQDWLQINQSGQSVVCGKCAHGQFVRPCYSAEGFQRYMEKVCGLALEAGADAVWFRKVGYNIEPDTCRCPLCVTGFREMLRQQQEAEAGSPSAPPLPPQVLARVRPPVYEDGSLRCERALQTASERQWLSFRSKSLARCLQRLAEFIRRRNSECAVGADVFRHDGDDPLWDQGISYPALLPLVDLASQVPLDGWPEEDRMRAFKTAHAFGATLVAQQEPLDPGRWPWDFTEGLVHQPASPGLLNFADGVEGRHLLGKRCKGSEWEREFEGQLRFCREHIQTVFQQGRPLAAVAVCRSMVSLGVGHTNAHFLQLSVEEILAQQHVPFGLVYEENLDDLERYKALILLAPGPASDVALQKVLGYVEGGGGLVLVGGGETFVGWSATVAETFKKALADGRPARHGEGSIVSAVGFKAPHSLEHYCYGDWRGAVEDVRVCQGKEILEAIAQVAGEMPLRCASAAGRFVVEPYALPSGATTVHVLSLDAQQPIRGLQISLACRQAPQQVLPLSPGKEYEPLPHYFDCERQRLHFRMAEVPRYVVFFVE